MTILPKKITPDNIKDAIITVRYSANLPYEILLGRFYDILVKKSLFNFVVPSLPSNATSVFGLDGSNSNNSQEGVTINIGKPEYLFHDDSIKIILKPYEILFNIIDEYISWEVYFPLIKKVINDLFESKNIINFSYIQIRYISHYPDIDLDDKVNVNLSSNFQGYNSENTSFRTTLKHQNLTATINIINKLNVLPNIEFSSTFLSVIDVLVIANLIPNGTYSSPNELFDVLDIAHGFEKDIFFKIMCDDYVNELNPQF